MEHAPLYYKPLEQEKIKQLSSKSGKFDAFMKVTTNIVKDISWCVENLQKSVRAISQGKPNIIINSDASLRGHGATVTYGKKGECSGVWSTDEQKLHINIPELKACQYALLALCKDYSDTHVRINVDNMTCLSYIIKYGGKTKVLNNIARDIW